MTHESEQALNNAAAFEIRKDGLTQRQSGDWVLRVVIQSIDMDQRIIKASMGARFQCVLVEIDDDETPIDHKGIERDKWLELGPARQAGIRCKQPTFRAFLEEELHYPNVNSSEERAAETVRSICGVCSRSELDKPNNSAARILWHDLDNAYQAWTVRENG